MITCFCRSSRSSGVIAVAAASASSWLCPTKCCNAILTAVCSPVMRGDLRTNTEAAGGDGTVAQGGCQIWAPVRLLGCCQALTCEQRGS